ncbi:hypothetical protein HOD19_00120 [bacterium]|jgi:hypothetical protein|nr:hypothetical protein [bacterium]
MNMDRPEIQQGEDYWSTIQSEAHTKKAAKAKTTERGDLYQKDSYYKSPENEQKRSLETIRQHIARNREIVNVVPDYLESREYEVNEKGDGAIHDYVDEITSAVSLMALHAIKYKDGKITKDLEEYSSLLQEQVDGFEEELFKVLSFNNDRKLISEDPDLSRMLSEPGDTLIRDLFIKYGEKYGFVDDASSWMFHSSEPDIKSELEYQIKRLKKEISTEGYQKAREELQGGFDLVREYEKKADDMSVDDALEIFQQLDDIYIPTHLAKDYPDLFDSVQKMNEAKVNIPKQIAEKIRKNPSLLKETSNDQMWTLLHELPSSDAMEFANFFIANSSPSRIIDFIQIDMNKLFVYPINDSIQRVTTQSDDLGDEKAEVLQFQVFDFCKNMFTKEFHGSIRTRPEANALLYNLVIQHLIYLKEKQPHKLKQATEELIEVLPTRQEFEIRHEGQLLRFGGFLEYVAGYAIDEKVFEGEYWERLIEITTQKDRRYPDVIQLYDNLKKKLLAITQA